jgi:hypothetical protein
MAGGPNSGFLDDLLSPDLQDDGTDLDRTTRVNYSGFTISQTRDADGGSTTHIENTGGGGGGGTIALADHNAFRALPSVPDKTVINFQSPPEQWVYFASDGAGFADDDTTILKLASVSVGSAGRAYPSSPSSVVATIAGLRLAKSGKQKSLHVQAHSSLGDGGGDVFDFDVSDTTSSDDGGNIIVAGTRRYKRRFSGKSAVSWFGAKADAVQVDDAAISASSATLTSATAMFKSSDVGKSVSVFGASINTLTGTATTVSGSRGVVGFGTSFSDDLWEGAAVTVGAATYTVSQRLTGTIALSSSVNFVGTSTKFLSELWPGAIIVVDAIRYQVATITDDTNLTVVTAAPNTASGFTGDLVSYNSLCTGTVTLTGGNTAVMGAGTLFTTELWVGAIIITNYGEELQVATIADNTHLTLSVAPTSPGGTVAGLFLKNLASRTRILLDTTAGSSASGLAVKGPAKPLRTTIQSFTNATTVVLAASATISVTGKRMCFGTDSRPAMSDAIAASRHVYIPEGKYLFASELTISRQGVEIEWLKGAQVYAAGPITVDATEVVLRGQAVGWTFAGDEGLSHDFKSSVMWIGDPSKEIIRASQTVAAHGLYMTGLIADANGQGGCTGVRLGSFAGGLGGAPGINIAHNATLDCQNGFNLQTNIEHCNLWRNFVAKRDSSVASTGIGIMVSADDHYVGASTSIWIQGGAVGAYKIGCQVGGPRGRPTTVQVCDMVFEFFGDIDGAAIWLYDCYKPEVSGLHVEQGLDSTQTNRCLIIGAPGHAPEGVMIHDNYFAGFAWIFEGHGWNGMVISSNQMDVSGASGGTFHNVGGWTRKSGNWLPQTQIGRGGSYAGDISAVTGFSFYKTENLDGSNNPHPVLGGPWTIADAHTITGTFTWDSDSRFNTSGTGMHYDVTIADGEFYSVRLDDGAGFFLGPKLAASGGNTVISNYIILRQGYWDGAAAQTTDFSVQPIIQSLSQANWEAYFGIGGVNGVFGYNNYNIMYFGSGGPGAAPSISVGLASTPEGVTGQTGKLGSLRTIADRLYLKTQNDGGNTGWQETIVAGAGDPNGAVTANIGAVFLRRDGGAGTTFYVKESGSGTNMGWVGK